MEIVFALEGRHVGQLHGLYQQEWWSRGRSLEATARVVACSQLCLGLLDERGDLQGFARVLSDFVFKAFIFDVIVAEPHRGQGWGDRLLEAVRRHPALADVRHFELYCRPELAPFYARHGFSADVGDIQLLRYSPA